MTIRSKIILSNLLMILMPFVLLFSAAGIWINTAGKQYWVPIEEMYEDSNGVISAQNLIYAYQEELWDTDWAGLEEGGTGGSFGDGAADGGGPVDGNSAYGGADGKAFVDGNADDGAGLESAPQTVRLARELLDLGYHFSVQLEGEILYSNLSGKNWSRPEA